MNHRRLPRHPFIVAFEGALVHGPWLVILLEFVEGRDLYYVLDDAPPSRTGGLLEDQAHCLFQQLVIAVEFMHRAGKLAHRDLKPEVIERVYDILR